MERSPRRIPLLHEFEHGGHAATLQLGQDGPAFELVVHHLDVGLDAADETGAGAGQFVHELLELRLELGGNGDEVELAPRVRGR